MKKLTPKQRREIYLKVAKIIEIGRADVYLCGHLASLIPNYELSLYHCEYKILPEFDLFEQKTTLWWDEFDKDSRINCMLFCAELTKTATE